MDEPKFLTIDEAMIAIAKRELDKAGLALLLRELFGP
jgi:hypothetical protein